PNAKKTPASISKILTSFGVLKRFPPGFHFYTRLLTDGKNLYLKGGGDPSFVSENMWYLVNEMSRSGIKNFKGDLVVDESLFDNVRFDASRESTRVDRAYDSPVGAMSFNWNAVNVFVKPTDANQKARVVVDPESGYFDLVNNTKTVTGTPKRDLTVSISNAEKLITVSGEVQQGTPEKAVFKGVEAPEMWSAINLKFFLAQRGITVDGKIKTGVTPDNAEQLAQYESKNLAYIMGDMNKFSNNFVAEMLTKGMAAEEVKQNASLKQGVEIIKNELMKIGLTENEVDFKNPSGLTRENAISAASMNKVLSSIKNDFSIFPTFVDSLPIAGIDGTLKKRFKQTAGEGWIRAKTGYIDGVVALAGFAGRRDGRVLTFTFLYNGPRDAGVVREAFDQVLLNSLK
ncbi:MAG: D-alanyl-D-alanine carboxypeptidase/D-alanyl-D-alanine endopeptidase, partial [Pseudobdellovibrio sp.]